MANLSRFNYLSQQRLDNYMLLADQSFAAKDLRVLVSAFSGIDKAYVLRGLEAVGTTGTSINIKVSDSLMFNPQDNMGSFYYGPSTLSEVIINLPANQATIYVEGTFALNTGAPVSAGFWDPLAQTNNSEGAEYSAPADTEVFIELSITYNTIGFTEGAVPILKATTTNTVTSIQDCRQYFWRLGTGGTTPDALNKFPWSSSRGEPVTSGAGVGNSNNSSFKSKDSSGITNDKGITSMKEWMDAVMTLFSEISGSSIWYLTGSSVTPASNLSLSQLFFDTIGHNIEASDNASMKWVKTGSNYYLKGEGTISGSAPFDTGLIKWKSNYNNIEWHLSDAFQSSTDRRYSTLRWSSDAIADGDNLYLNLEREVSKGSGAGVVWKPAAIVVGGWTVGETVSGSSNDFTGIAIGDFIRKESEGYSQYYKVKELWDGSVTFNTYGKVADSTITALRVGTGFDFTTPIPTSSTEPLKYFRARYSSDDLINAQSGVFNDANLYWLGRRKGNFFFLKDYGTMQDGEEVVVIDGHFAQGYAGGSDLIIEKGNGTVFSSQTLSGSGARLTIRRYKRDDTADYPSPGDNSGSYLTYTISADIASFVNGDGLWARLSDTTSGALSAGSVTNSSDDLTNLDTVTNTYERRSAANSPTRTFDNKDVFLIARAVTVNSVLCLAFIDGSVLGPYGEWIHNDVQIKDNLILGDDYIDVLVNTNFNLLGNLGQRQLTIGSSASTTYIPGDLIVDGNTTSANVDNLTIDDKVITLGVGNLASGETGSGIEVAGDTATASLAATTSGSNIVTLTVATTSFLTGTIIGVSATQDVGGITAGGMSRDYTVVAGAPATPGEAQASGPTTLLIYTGQTASATTSSGTTPPRVYNKKYSIRVSNKDTGYTGSPTSLRLDWNGLLAEVHPFDTTHKTVPLAHTADFSSERIPFAGNDGNGPGGADVTFSFSSNFRFLSHSNTLLVAGDSGAQGIVATDIFEAQHLLANPLEPIAGYTRIYGLQDYYLYQRTPDGNINSFLKGENVYKEVVDVVSVPTGNNQMAPGATPSITLPLDTKKHIGTGLIATTDGSTADVVVMKKDHGLTSGEMITVVAVNAIGGIIAGDLSGTFTVTVLSLDSFQYTAASVSTSIDQGNLDDVKAESVRNYLVGYDQLKIQLNGQLMTKDVDYNEVGAYGTASNQIDWLQDLELTDQITYRIDSDSGLVIIQSAGGSDLQAAYLNGEIITVSPGTPVTLNGTGTLLAVNGDLLVTGIII